MCLHTAARRLTHGCRPKPLQRPAKLAWMAPQRRKSSASVTSRAPFHLDRDALRSLAAACVCFHCEFGKIWYAPALQQVCGRGHRAAALPPDCHRQQADATEHQCIADSLQKRISNNHVLALHNSAALSPNRHRQHTGAAEHQYITMACANTLRYTTLHPGFSSAGDWRI